MTYQIRWTSRGVFRASQLQWQPSLTAHDPNPPLPLESPADPGPSTPSVASYHQLPTLPVRTGSQIAQFAGGYFVPVVAQVPVVAPLSWAPHHAAPTRLRAHNVGGAYFSPGFVPAPPAAAAYYPNWVARLAAPNAGTVFAYVPAPNRWGLDALGWRPQLPDVCPRRSLRVDHIQRTPFVPGVVIPPIDPLSWLGVLPLLPMRPGGAHLYQGANQSRVFVDLPPGGGGVLPWRHTWHEESE